MSEIGLKPCPFCGSDELKILCGECGVFVGCTICGCCTQAVPLSATYAAKPEAIAAWNRRSGVAPNKAKWEICCDGYYPYCSNCHKEPQGREMTKYCPNCGAEMCNPQIPKRAGHDNFKPHQDEVHPLRKGVDNDRRRNKTAV